MTENEVDARAAFDAYWKRLVEDGIDDGSSSWDDLEPTEKFDWIIAADAAKAHLRERHDRLVRAAEPIAASKVLPGAPDDGYISGWLLDYEGTARISQLRELAAALAAEPKEQATQ